MEFYERRQRDIERAAHHDETANLRQQVAGRNEKIARLMEAIVTVMETLEFHEGSEKVMTEGGNPVVWINAQGEDGDFQVMLATLRRALKGDNND
tara:strand:- start:56 stop:340 length:285 start_codon:yes stop_codon:yes gene_type:complete